MKNKSVIIAAVIIGCLLAITTLVYLQDDRMGPIITVDSSKVQPYAKEQGTETLISFATARDLKDGDVTSSIIIENVYLTSDCTNANVTYVARDKSGNITKLTYVVKYLPTDEELKGNTAGTNTEPTTAHESSNGTNTQQTTQSQSSNGNTNENTKASQPTTSNADAPIITLTANEATIKVHGNFNVMNYVDNITDDKDAKDVLVRRVIASGEEVKTSVPGTYIVQVYCTDSDRNVSNKEKLTVNVVE